MERKRERDENGMEEWGKVSETKQYRERERERESRQEGGIKTVMCGGETIGVK